MNSLVDEFGKFNIFCLPKMITFINSCCLILIFSSWWTHNYNIIIFIEEGLEFKLSRLKLYCVFGVMRYNTKELEVWWKNFKNKQIFSNKKCYLNKEKKRENSALPKVLTKSASVLKKPKHYSKKTEIIRQFDGISICLLICLDKTRAKCRCEIAWCRCNRWIISIAQSNHWLKRNEYRS